MVGRRKRLIAAESGLKAAMRRLGHTAIIVDDRKLRQRIGRDAGSEWLRWRVRLFRPDRVIFFKNHDANIDVVREIAGRYPTSLWYRDIDDPLDPAIVERAAAVDAPFITAGGQLDQYRAAGVRNPQWLPNAADAVTDHPAAADPALACDVAFIGRAVWRKDDLSRLEFLLELARHFDVRVWGQDWERWAKPLNWDGTAAYGDKFARVCASAKIVLDVQPHVWFRVRDEYYSSNRMVKAMACRGFVLGQGGRALQQLFREEEHCGWFEDNAEAFGQIEKYLADERLREAAREAGHRHVRAHHMMENRVHNLLTGAPFTW